MAPNQLCDLVQVNPTLGSQDLHCEVDNSIPEAVSPSCSPASLLTTTVAGPLGADSTDGFQFPGCLWSLAARPFLTALPLPGACLTHSMHLPNSSLSMKSQYEHPTRPHTPPPPCLLRLCITPIMPQLSRLSISSFKSPQAILPGLSGTLLRLPTNHEGFENPRS